jgi:diacylglycerol kinase (ATP)
MVTLKSFRYAAHGLKMVLSSERNARIHIAFAIIALLLSIVLRIDLQQWLFVVISIALVFFAEITNTAIEKTLDLISQENNQLIKIIKDMTAAGVLVTAISAVIVAALIFLPRIVSVASQLLAR